LRPQGTRILEERVLCDGAMLGETVRQSLGSDKKLASYLGVSDRTAREYRLGRVSLPASLFAKLQTLNPDLRATERRDAFWGQRKGGQLAPHPSHGRNGAIGSLTKARSSHLPQKNESVRRHRTYSLVSALTRSSEAVALFSISTSLIVEHKPALAEFVGRILGDGSPIIAPTYSASEVESQRRMQSLVGELFDYNPEIKISKGNYRIQLKRICGHTLKLLGIPLGRKSVTNPPVPTFIMESNEPEVWLSFLRGIFDDEAYVSERGVEVGLAVRQIDLNSSTNNLSHSRILDQISELLSRLGVYHVRRRGQIYRVNETNSICWFLRIPRREFGKIQDLKLFLLPQKAEKLTMLCKKR